MLSEASIIAILDELIDYQKKKVWEIGKRLHPQVTEEDLRNPDDIPELSHSAQFHFEDGILAGYLSVRIALLVEMKQKDTHNE